MRRGCRRAASAKAVRDRRPLSSKETHAERRTRFLNFAESFPITQLPATAGWRVRMSLLTWNDTYSVGVKTIDQQHSGLFAIVNELHAAMMNRQAKNVMGALLDKLVKYTQEHFAYEERMMDSSKFPGSETHKAHHVELTKQVVEFMGRYKRGDTMVNVELLRFLSEWLTKHIQKEDKEYGPWLARQGMK